MYFYFSKANPKAMRRSIVAENSVLDAYRCNTEKIPVESVSSKPNEAHNTDLHVEVLSHPSGWKFQSFHRHILNEKERKELAASFRKHLRQVFPSFTTTHPITEEDDDDLHWDNFKLHIPPMLFDRDIMQFDFKSWGSVSVSAKDALFCWLCQHVPEVCEEHPLHVVQVPYAKKWASRLSSVPISPCSSPMPLPLSAHHHATPNHGITPIQESGKHHHRDSFSTGATPKHELYRSTKSDSGLPPPPPPTPGSTDTAHPTLTTIRASDWTYSTDYSCSLLHQANESNQQQQQQQRFVVHGQTFHRSNIYSLHHDNVSSEAPSYSSPWTVTQEASCGIDYELLRRRDLPILFYDEMTLYEDDLEDCGEISVEAKVRVMPNCWFALVRYFLRIDNVLVRSRETRLFHVFPTDDDTNDDIKIHVEVLWREKQLDDEVQGVGSAPHTPHTPCTAVNPSVTTTLPVGVQASPATSAVLRTSGGSVPAALAKVMHGTALAAAARSASTSTATTSHHQPGTNLHGSVSLSNVSSTTTASVAAAAAAAHIAPSTPHLLIQRYTKENASELLPRVNDALDIPAYYTFTLRDPSKVHSSAPHEAEQETHETHPHHNRQMHLFGLAAAHGVRK